MPNLYFKFLQNSPVWSSEEGTYWPLRTLPHSFGEQPFPITSRHTKRWAPKQYRTDPFMRTSAQCFSHRCVPSTTGLFRYLHMTERCRWHKGYPQTFLFSYSVKQAHFKAFICAKPLINSAHAAFPSLPLLKYYVL